MKRLKHKKVAGLLVIALLALTAVGAYAFFTSTEVQEVGYIDHPSIAMSGASCDGLVGDIGLVEIKCPNTATQIDTLLGEPIENKYTLQMQWQMAVTGRQW